MRSVARGSSIRGKKLATQASHHPRGKAKAKPKPLSAHPLFPAIVALWFGALFGLGSLAIRPALIEALVLKLHIDVILPFAAPPLGIKARVLMALGMAIGGGMIGIALGRSIARPRSARAPSNARRQGVMAGLAGMDGHAGSAQQQARRRPLAVQESYEPQYHTEYAPLPGGQPQVLDVTEFGIMQEEHDDGPSVAILSTPAPEAPAATPETLDLSGFLAGVSVPATAAEPVPVARPFEVMPSADSLARPFDAGPFAQPLPEVLTTSATQPAATAQAEETMNHSDLIERLARSMQERRERLARARSFEPAAAAPVAVPTEPVPEAAEPPVMPVEPVIQPLITPPMAMPAALRPLVFDDPYSGPSSSDNETQDDLAHVPGRMIPMPSQIGQAETPSDDEAEPDVLEEGYSSLLGLSRHAPLREATIRIEDDVLSDISSREIEPAVIFPGQAPFAKPVQATASRPFDMPRDPDMPEPGNDAGAQTPPTLLHRIDSAEASPVAVPTPATSPAVLEQREETERALRTALSTLQRMSGTA